MTSIQYRIEEYYALKGEISSFSGAALGDFSREEMNIEEYQIPHVKSISLIDKVRVVNALIVFSRINPAMNQEDVGFVSVKVQNTHWYPAYEVRGKVFLLNLENRILMNG